MTRARSVLNYIEPCSCQTPSVFAARCSIGRQTPSAFNSAVEFMSDPVGFCGRLSISFAKVFAVLIYFCQCGSSSQGTSFALA